MILNTLQCSGQASHNKHYLAHMSVGQGWTYIFSRYLPEALKVWGENGELFSKNPSLFMNIDAPHTHLGTTVFSLHIICTFSGHNSVLIALQQGFHHWVWGGKSQRYLLSFFKIPPPTSSNMSLVWGEWGICGHQHTSPAPCKVNIK